MVASLSINQLTVNEEPVIWGNVQKAAQNTADCSFFLPWAADKTPIITEAVVRLSRVNLMAH